jgi:hypothetical protein
MDLRRQLSTGWRGIFADPWPICAIWDKFLLAGVGSLMVCEASIFAIGFEHFGEMKPTAKTLSNKNGSGRSSNCAGDNVVSRPQGLRRSEGSSRPLSQCADPVYFS